MKTEYALSIERWVQGLTDQKLADAMENLDRYNDEEFDALIREDIRRISLEDAL